MPSVLYALLVFMLYDELVLMVVTFMCLFRVTGEFMDIDEPTGKR